MITAIDSSILIDFLAGQEADGERATVVLKQAADEGALVVCETVLAEVTPVIGAGRMPDFLEACGIRFEPSSVESSLLAGESFRTYLRRGGKRSRVVADFLIAAHAQTHADRLLTRDRGYYRDYFKKLKVWEP